MTKQMTPWFPSGIKPVHVGVYQTKWYCVDEWDHGFAYWNGHKWSNGAESVEGAYGHKSWINGAVQSKKWRGFTEKQS